VLRPINLPNPNEIGGRSRRGVWGENHWSIGPLDRIDVEFLFLQNPKKSVLQTQKAVAWHRGNDRRMLATQSHQKRACGGIGGQKVFDFDLLDRCANALSRPQNETFLQETAENAARFHPFAERAGMGLKVPTVGTAGTRQGRKVCFMHTESIPPNTLQTRRPLQELIFTQECSQQCRSRLLNS
jgi:hypothetical protein